MASSLTYPQDANLLRVNSYIMHQNSPCKIVHLSKSKTGKHGGAKISFTVKGLFDDKRADGFVMSYDKVECPLIKKHEFYVMDVEAANEENDFKPFLSLMNEDDGSTRQDIRLDSEELIEKVYKAVVEDEKDVLVNVVQAMEKNRVVSFKMI